MRPSVYRPHVAAAIIVVIALAHVSMHWGYTIDDAYITYRYSRSLVDGLGLTFNPGEWTKGCSNTLYTLLMAIPEATGLPTNTVSKFLGVAAFLWTIWLAYRLGSLFSLGGIYRLIAPLALAGCSSMALWSVGGLETGFFAALAFAAACFRLQEQDTNRFPLSMFIVAAATLSRPEGIVFYVALAVHSAVVCVVLRRLRMRDAVWFAVPVLVYGSELLISWRYYGRPFPQTFYAKLHNHGRLEDLVSQLLNFHHGEGYAYLGAMIRANVGWLPLVLALPAGLFRRSTFRLTTAVLICLAAHCAYVFAVKASSSAFEGPAFRYGVPMLPFLMTSLVVGIHELHVGLKRHLSVRYVDPAVTVAGLAVLLLFASSNYTHSAQLRKHKLVDAGSRLDRGELVRRSLPPGHLVSSYDIGGVGYASKMAILDTAGLVEPTTVRCRWDQKRSSGECGKLAKILSPDVVLQHKSKERWLGNYLKGEKQYLRVKQEGPNAIWVRREHVTTQQLPPWAVRVNPVREGTAPVAHSVPGVTRPGMEISAEVFWQRGQTPPEKFVRELIVEHAGDRHVYPIQNLWTWLSLDEWGESEYLIDHFFFEVPNTEGLAIVSIKLNQGEPVKLARVHVSSEPSRKDIKQASLPGGPNWRNERVQAFALGTREAYAAYQDATIDEASKTLKVSKSAPWQERAGAIHAAQNLLRRAYYESPNVSARLRAAIDDAGRVRKALLGQVVPSLML